MPIEIKELHIKVTVNASGGEGQNSTTPAAAPAAPPPDKEALVAECVEQVLQILKAQQDR